MIITTATRKGIPELSNAYLSAFESVKSRERWTPEAAASLIEFYYGIQGDLLFIAKEGAATLGGPIGIVKPWWDGNHLIEVELCVKAEHQKQGMDKALLVYLLATAIDQHDVIHVDSITFRHLKYPLCWYRKLGLVENKQLTLISGDARIMRKRLAIS